MIERLLSRLYGTAVTLRNQAYENGLLRVARASVPVISVGNITVGGSGKTPVVEYLLHHLLRNGCRAAVITRGYRRETRGTVLVSDGRDHIVTARQGGDEAVQIAAKFSGLVVIADENRVRGARKASSDFDIDVIILDDAYQHRALHRDLDIVVIDAIEHLYTQRLLPAGRLREPLESLRRADLILLSKCEPTIDVAQAQRSLSAFTNVPVFATRYVPLRICQLASDDTSSADALRAMKLGVFCGIALPEGFHRTLQGLGLHTVFTRDFPDHHWYDGEDIDALLVGGETTGVQAWITTEKDAVRLKDSDLWQRLGKVYYPEMAVECMGDEHALFAHIGAQVRCAAVR
ncbi:MAG: tetraacyldisaccharide 4'-kinase [Bacteroidetes bacterium]|nr:tetraacyldisaccharide 4'-kinase [Bacteroidota bacterium]